MRALTVMILGVSAMCHDPLDPGRRVDLGDAEPGANYTVRIEQDEAGRRFYAQLPALGTGALAVRDRDHPEVGFFIRRAPADGPGVGWVDVGSFSLDYPAWTTLAGVTFSPLAVFEWLRQVADASHLTLDPPAPAYGFRTWDDFLRYQEPHLRAAGFLGGDRGYDPTRIAYYGLGPGRQRRGPSPDGQ
jgi:hypothetical protein